MADEKELQTIKQLLDNAESQIRQARSILFNSELSKKVEHLDLSADGEVIEGIFDGENMIGPDKKSFPVPANYASKSKLVAGDILKLTISKEGSFIFKQIHPVKRKKLLGDLEETSDGRFVVNCDGKKYCVLLASVTYFRGQEGDKLTIIVPEKGETEWAAIENKIPKN